MATELPVPMCFQLPSGWLPVRPDDLGSPAVAYMALCLATRGCGFTARLTLDGSYRPDAATLTDMADVSLRSLDASAVLARKLVHRKDVGSPGAPALTQRIAITAAVDGGVRELVQEQVYLAMLDVHEPRKRAVVRAILMSTKEHYAAVVDDFREFVRSLRPGA